MQNAYTASVLFITYFSVICKVGFTILSHAVTLTSLPAIRRIPIFSIRFLGGSGSALNSFALICFDFDTIDKYLSYMVELSNAKRPKTSLAHISSLVFLVSIKLILLCVDIY